jgi:nicotinate-nucleotide adenylyltransferase
MPTHPGRRERLGILGGTFDPPHLGHLAAARTCRAALGLDRVLFVVANDPWQKSPRRHVTPAADRLAMTEAAVAGLDGVEVSRIELERGGPSYTIDTVEAIDRAARADGRPAPEQFLIVGGDLLDTLDTWHRADELARRVTLVVVARPGFDAASRVPGWRAEVLSGEKVDVSSSLVRALVAAGQPIGAVVPEAVERYIRAHSLYAVGR